MRRRPIALLRSVQTATRSRGGSQNTPGVARAQEVTAPTLPAALAAAYAVVASLHLDAGLREILAPLPARDGSYAFRFGRFAVAVFPFMDGSSLWEIGATAPQTVDAAAVVARRRG